MNAAYILNCSANELTKFISIIAISSFHAVIVKVTYWEVGTSMYKLHNNTLTWNNFAFKLYIGGMYQNCYHFMTLICSGDCGDKLL